MEQMHRNMQKINEALENKKNCTAAFLDISQAFDKAWHTGLLCKLRRPLSLNYFLILKYYLHSRHFLVKVETEYTELSSLSQCKCSPRQCPRAVIIPAIHCTPANFTRIYHSNLCRWYCSSNHGQWFSRCFTETTNRPTCNSKPV
jgi:hypothetical protein